MNIKDTVNISGVSDVPKFKGHAQIDLMRKGKVVKRIEHDNAITPALNNLLKAQFMGQSVGVNNMYSINDYFSGCFLVDDNIDYTDTPPMYLPNSVNITAHAGQTPNNSEIAIKRGSPNAIESGYVDNNGYKFVWDWKTSEGNGNIGAICLTHKTNGYNGIGTNENALLLASLKSDDKLILPSDVVNPKCAKFNPSKNIYFVFTYTSGKFTIEERAYSIVSARMNHHRVLSTHEVTTTISFPTGTWKNRWVSFDGDYAYFCCIPSNAKTTVQYCKINLNDFTAEDKSFTMTVNLYLEIYADSWSVNMHPVMGGYMYMFEPYFGKAYKVNLSNTADIVELENPDGIVISSGNYIQVQSWYRCGDILVCPRYNNNSATSTDVSIMVYQNKIRRCPNKNTNAGGVNNSNGTVFADNVNGMLVGSTPTGYTSEWLAPNFITTVNNLDSVVTKTPDLTMKLTYTISEAE